jgi:proteic killer suppression protein
MGVVIRNIRHKGLRKFWQSGDTAGIDARLEKRLQVRLDVMDAATQLSQLDRAGWNLHELKGSRTGTWSLCVNGPWRLTFQWDDATEECSDIDLEQYH